MSVDDQRQEPGVCHEPVSWDVLQDIVQDGSVDALGTLGRTVKDLEIYDEFKDKVIRREYASTVDYLMIKVFECESKHTSGMLTLLSLIPPVSCAASNKPLAM